MSENICPACQHGRTVTEAEVVDHLEYGVAPENVTLLVRQIVISCKCGERWTDWRGEAAREECVARYRRVMGGGALRQANELLKRFQRVVIQEGNIEHDKLWDETEAFLKPPGTTV